ncbi:hypothetical protein [Desulfobacter curvatus]|uniref:hypothetical protein n=1 Tax=Desulfobacter curvatus TaxID=2290 RepID=UPI00037B8D68|nr:hypothetical protein [Desulfobacter curvatus]
MSFLKTYIHYIMQPAKQLSESGSLGSFLPDLHQPIRDDAPAARKSESGKHSFLSSNEQAPAGQLDERPVLFSEKSHALVSPITEPSASEIRFSNDSLPEKEFIAVSGVAFRPLTSGIDASETLKETESPGANQEVRQRPVKIFKTNFAGDISGTDDSNREEPMGPVKNPEIRNDPDLASRSDLEMHETGEFEDASRNPDLVPEPVRPMKFINKNSGKNPERSIPQKKTSPIEQQNSVNESTARVEVSDHRLEKIFPHQAEPAHNSLSKTVQPAREVPQVRIGHINVLVEDRSKTNVRPGQGRVAAAPPPNTFGLKGV